MGHYRPRQTVRVVRYLDGHRIETWHEHLTSDDVVALRWQEECLPGEVIVFEVNPRARPWENDDTET